MRTFCLLLALPLACEAPPLPADTAPAADTADTAAAPDTVSGAVVLTGGTIVSGPHADQQLDIRLEAGSITAVGSVPTDNAQVIDVSGQYLAPAFIDSHVHLAYLPEAEAMAAGGIAAAVDLAAPLAALSTDTGPLRVLWSGPMITAVGGYPTQSWGADGYGLECASEADIQDAVAQLAAAGAAVIKAPQTSGATLSADQLAAAAAAAHDHGLLLAVHALSGAQAATAAAAGADLLAHTPTGALEAETLAAWSGGAVVSTLDAFGDSDTARANLRALADAGATVLYGTDFGNSRTAGIQSGELDALVAAGLSGTEILAAGTSAPAAWWGLDDLGVIDIGHAASVLVLADDPRETPQSLATPTAVWLDGVRADDTGQ